MQASLSLSAIRQIYRLTIYKLSGNDQSECLNGNKYDLSGIDGDRQADLGFSEISIFTKKTLRRNLRRITRAQIIVVSRKASQNGGQWATTPEVSTPISQEKESEVTLDKDPPTSYIYFKSKWKLEKVLPCPDFLTVPYFAQLLALEFQTQVLLSKAILTF